MKFPKRAAQQSVGILISLGLLVWIAGMVEWREVGVHLRNVHYWVFAPVSLVFLLHYILRAWRWRYLLPSDPRDQHSSPKLRVLFDSLMVGNFATFVLPLRAGEFVRSFLLAHHTRYSFSTSFVSVIIERFFDLCAVLGTFAFVVTQVHGLPPWVHQGAWALSFLAICIFVFIIIGSFAPTVVLNIAGLFLRPVPIRVRGVINKFLADFLEGAAILKRPKNLAMTTILTVAVWGSCYLLFYMFLWFFDIEASILLALAIAVIVALAVAAPSAPGFLGVYQTACIAAFSLFGVSREIGTAYSLVSHFYQYVIFVGYGMYVLFVNELKLTDLARRDVANDR